MNSSLIRFRGIFVLIIFSLALSFTGFSCTFFQNKTTQDEATRPITVTIWGVNDAPGALDPLIGAYHAQHPNVNIAYQQFRQDQYENAILQALAEDRGPDIIELPNTGVDRYLTKLAPMPPSMNIGFQVMKGTIQKVMTYEVRQTLGYSPSQVRDTFLDVVGNDVIRPIDGKEQVMALPFFVDTLGLFYNKTLLRNTGVIIGPPQYWAVSDTDPQAAQKKALFEDFSSQAQKMTIIDPTTTQIIQSGAAFGASKNIDHAADILETLMMQNGAQMSANGHVNFDYDPSIPRPLAINPGVDALRFYTDFASPVKQVYSWSADMPDSLSAFAQSKTAMFFGYSSDAQSLKNQAPQLSFGVVPVPQINAQQPAVIANYWVQGVLKKSKNSDYAWDFLRFSTQPDTLKKYLDATKHPTPLKSQLYAQEQDPDLAPFASQLLFARSWYHGMDAAGAESALDGLIDTALTVKGATIDEERSRLTDALTTATQTIQNGWNSLGY